MITCRYGSNKHVVFLGVFFWPAAGEKIFGVFFYKFRVVNIFENPQTQNSASRVFSESLKRGIPRQEYFSENQKEMEM